MKGIYESNVEDTERIGGVKEHDRQYCQAWHLKMIMMIPV